MTPEEYQDEVLARLDEIIAGLNNMIEFLPLLLSVSVEVKHWLMLLFFVSSIGFGLGVGFLVGKR